MDKSMLTRRRALTTAGLGVAGIAGLTSRAEAADWTASERTNVQVVNGFCAAWSSHEADKVVSFLASAVAYRPIETAEPIKGRDAVAATIKSLIDRVEKFEILTTFAKGPMVFNERIDYFTSGQLASWHGVGVFFLKDEKISEWYDYTISMARR
jgi:limonene-1,2-epoxide hydrolase